MQRRCCCPLPAPLRLLRFHKHVLMCAHAHTRGHSQHITTSLLSLGGCVVRAGSGSRTLKCDVHSERELSRAGLVLTVLGVWLFLSARQLSMSSSFRLTSGSFMFMTGMVLLVAMVLMRCVYDCCCCCSCCCCSYSCCCCCCTLPLLPVCSTLFARPPLWPSLPA